MRRCAFLTMDTLDGFVSDDELVHAPLQQFGWQIDSVPWRKDNIDWAQYDAVLIRTTWDYHSDPEKFLQKLEEISSSGTLLLNPLDLVTWNIHKTYLFDLEQKGIRIVPSLWPQRIDREQLYFALDDFGSNEIIVKPLISAGARNTFRISCYQESSIARIVEILKDTECVIQPFIPNVITEGEFSVFYFGGSYSHTVLKTPKQQDFRVQEEHGGFIRSVIADPVLLEYSQQVLNLLESTPFYARVDWVRGDDGKFHLMELELIEPSLYFRTDSSSPVRFARAFEEWMSCKAL